MKCIICKNGETEKGLTTVALTRNDFIIVFKNVPADICSNCGEKYFDEETTRELLKNAEVSKNTGAELDIREFKAA